MSTDQSTIRVQSSTRQVGIVLGVLAIVLFAHPLYLWPQLGSDPSALLLAGFARPILTLIAAVLFPFACLTVYRDTWRPITPLTAVLFPLTASLAILALQWYDLAVHGLGGIHSLNNNPGLVGALSLIFLVGGSLARQQRTRALAAFVLAVLGLFLLGVVIDQTRPPIALVSALALGIAGAVIGVIGYGLSAEPPSTGPR